jgi:hypothetical protein
MQHLAAYLQSVDPASAYVQLASIADSILTVNSPRIQVPALNQVILVAAGAETTVVPRARLVSPSLLQVFRHQITPLSGAAAGAVTPASPHRIQDLRGDPLTLVVAEQLTAELFSDPAAPQIQWVLVWFSDKPPVSIAGKIFTARATVANALVSSVWTLNTLTFDDQLPRGKYQIVGFRPMGTTMIAARLIVPSQLFRPGALGVQLVTDQGSDIFRYGNLDVYGEFEDVDNLQIESLAAAADTAASQQYWVDLIQIRAGNA